MLKDPSFVGMTNQKEWLIAAIPNVVNYLMMSSRRRRDLVGFKSEKKFEFLIVQTVNI